MSRYQIHTEIEIASSPDRVWKILTDFAAYPEWNPFIKFARGVPQQGTRLDVHIQPSGTKGMTFHPTVLVADVGRELRWRGRFLFPGVFDGEHCFLIEVISNEKVRFRQSEQFSGILVPIFRASLDRDARRGFEEMNLALKARAEAR